MAGSTERLPRLMTIEELAEHLGVTERHVRRLVAERRVPYLKWRRFIRFDPDEIAAWLDGARRPEATTAVGEAQGRRGA
ncbi:MAG: helix-turn-helix domain-containing protein [Acidimicrobiales bacterium]